MQIVPVGTNFPYRTCPGWIYYREAHDFPFWRPAGKPKHARDGCELPHFCPVTLSGIQVRPMCVNDVLLVGGPGGIMADDFGEPSRGSSGKR